MKRLVFWMTKRFNSGRYCHHCCMRCECYEICRKAR